MKLTVRAVLLTAGLGVALLADQPLKSQDPLPSEFPYTLYQYTDRVGEIFTWEVVGDTTGRVFGTDVYTYDSKLERERTFYDWLDASERATARNIARVESCGINTVSCRTLYDVAHVIRGRELPSRMEALSLFFRANVETRILLRISGMGAK